MNPSLLRLKIIINYGLTIENNADDSKVKEIVLCIYQDNVDVGN